MALGGPPCANTPLSFMFTSGTLTVNYGLGWVNPSLRLSFDDGIWQASGTWLASYCNNTEVPTDVTFDLIASGGGISGTYTSVRPAGKCAEGKAVETLLPAALPSWWNGSLCDNTDTSTYNAKTNPDPFTSYQGPPAWHGLISCGGNAPYSGEYPIQSGPLSGDEEWQCAELAQRWLYMAFGVPNVPQGLPPAGGGNSVAYKYYTQQLEKYPGKYPLTYYGPGSSGPFGPGDVVSYGTTAPGHVGIVTSVDPKTKTYSIIQQNPARIVTGIKYRGSGDNITPEGFGGIYSMNGWLHFTPFLVEQA